MDKKWIGIGGIIIILLIGVMTAISSYNGLVNAETEVEEKQANIKTQLQRRADLIPNLVQTVKNYSAHETEVFDAVNKSREAVKDASTIEEMEKASDSMEKSITQVTALAEAYPELKSDKVYMGLIDELAGTENRIAVARKDYNGVVKSYNQKVRHFPSSIIAGMSGFEKKDYFESTENAQDVPEVGTFE